MISVCTIQKCVFNNGQEGCLHEDPDIRIFSIMESPGGLQGRGVGFCDSINPRVNEVEDHKQEKRRAESQ